MIPILYENNETAFTSNGLGRLRDTISAVVCEERNGVYTLDFEYPITGAHFDEITIGRVVAVTHDEAGGIEPFDIVGYERPIGGVVTFHAVHISYRLSGMTTWAKNINSLSDALSVFNNISGNLFTFSADFTSTAYMAAFDGVPRTVRQLMGGVEGSILDAYGGEWEFTGYNAILHRSRGETKDITIRYGVNMAKYDETADAGEIYNACVPFWTGQDANGAAVVVRGSRVDSGQMLPSGRNVIAPLDLTEKFESKPTATQLNNMAASVMRARSPWLPAQNIRVDFIRLQDMAGFEQFANLWDCSLCDSVTVVFPRYNMAGQYKIVKTTWDVLKGRYTEMELGQLSTTLSEALGISQGGTFTETNGGGGGGVSDVMMNGASIVDTDGIAQVTDAAGNMTINGSLYMGNAKTIYMKDTGGTYRAVVSESTRNNTVIGYGGYDASQGGTNIYGNTVRLYSHNPIVTDQPFAALFKVTDVSKSVSGISAHSYQAGISFSMTAQSGYTAVGVVGWSSSNYRIYPFRVEVTSNTNITASLANATAAGSADFTMHFYVLWLKATSD